MEEGPSMPLAMPLAMGTIRLPATSRMRATRTKLTAWRGGGVQGDASARGHGGHSTPVSPSAESESVLAPRGRPALEPPGGAPSDWLSPSSPLEGR
eukprot:137806-Prorocentrum_minimum.AAC.1